MVYDVRIWEAPFKYSADLRFSQHLRWVTPICTLKFSLLFNKFEGFAFLISALSNSLLPKISLRARHE